MHENMFNMQKENLLKKKIAKMIKIKNIFF